VISRRLIPLWTDRSQDWWLRLSSGRDTAGSKGPARGGGGRVGLSICIGLGWRRVMEGGGGAWSKLSMPGSRVVWLAAGWLENRGLGASGV
jgi:hypothetical protein